MTRTIRTAARRTFIATLCGLATSACVGGDPELQESAAPDLTTLRLAPSTDVSARDVVGSPDTTALFGNVDDGTSASAADDGASFVAGVEGVRSGAHTVGYASAQAGLVTSVVVHLRAQLGSARRGTARIALYDGDELVAQGALHTLGRSWRGFTDTFGELAVAQVASLRTEVSLENTSRSARGALRYTQLWIDVTADACVPTSCAAAEASCGTVPDGCGGTLDCGACEAEEACGDATCEGAETCGACPQDCGTCPIADGRTYFVSTTGDDSISCAQATDPATPKRNLMGAQGGIACLQTPGETLMIRGGTYEESLNNFTGEPTVWPSGTSWDEAFTIAAWPGETVTVRGIAIATDDVNHLWTVSYWIFDGLHVVNTWGGEAIWMREPDHIRFINMEATTVSRPDQCVQGGGLSIQFINLDVHDCGDPAIEHCGGACGASYGFYWWGDDCLFDHIRLRETTGYGFHFFSSACDTTPGHNCPDRNVVRYSTIYDTGTRQGSAAILFAYGDANAAYGNVIRNNDNGIAVGYGATNTRIENNTIVGNTYAGIDHGAGWASKPNSGGLLRNNIVAFNGANGIVNSASGTPLGEPTGTAIEHNLMFGNGYGDEVVDTGTGTVASGNLVTDPMFADRAAGDLHLQPCSPAVDAGLSVPEVSFDLDGVERPQAGVQDIGALESTAGACGI